MSRLIWIFVALVVFVPSRAVADVTARYTGRTGPDMVIAINDRGDSRIAMGNQMALLTLDGTAYLIMADLGGTYLVAFDDAVAVMGDQVRTMMDGRAMPPIRPDSPAFRMTAVEGGTETVGGRSGTVWTLLPADAPDDSEGWFDVVTSADPDLAPIGRVVVALFGKSTDAMHGLMGPAAGPIDGLGETLRSILERGTPIRFGRLLRLESVDFSPIPASTFALPSTPLTRAEYAARTSQTAAPAPQH